MAKRHKLFKSVEKVRGYSIRTEGSPVVEEDLAHLSPARFEHVNPDGKSVFPIDQALQRHGVRPLRAA